MTSDTRVPVLYMSAVKSYRYDYELTCSQF